MLPSAPAGRSSLSLDGNLVIASRNALPQPALALKVYDVIWVVVLDAIDALIALVAV